MTGMAAITEATPAYHALGGNLSVFEGVWHHGWVLPTREQINAFFCTSFHWNSTRCRNATELDVSREDPSYLEWNDKELQVTSTGQVNTAPECIGPGAKISKTVHNFSHDMTIAHAAALARRRQDAPRFIRAVFEQAPNISGFIAPTAPTRTRFLGAQFVVPHPPGCVPGRFIPGCPNPSTAGAGMRRCGPRLLFVFVLGFVAWGLWLVGWWVLGAGFWAVSCGLRVFGFGLWF